MADSTDDEELWQATYTERQRFFEATIGPLPDQILKMLNMTGVWPGGGLFVIPAEKIGPALAVYTTFGLTNPDMPTGVQMTAFELDSDGQRATKAEGRLETKDPAPKRAGVAGYGYEILVVAQADLRWPLMFLQWAVNAEITHDVGLLSRVEECDGLTVEEIDVGPGGPINVLITKAQPPLPVSAELPSGTMQLLVATAITEEEMRWSMTSGRGGLLHRLQDGGIGQVSLLGRPSVAL